MKINRLIVLLILLISISGYSQIKNFEEIEKYVKEVPQSETSDIETLTKYLKKNAKTKTEILARIYFWMVQNIEYDWDAVRNNEQIDVSAISTLENRKSVCAGYANLFKAICDNAKIKCVVIDGYAKATGFYHGEKLTKPNHAWNAVKLYDKWEFVDVTWGRESILTNEGQKELWNARYFLDDPNDFILEHFPEDEVWQLLDNEISIDNFFSAEMEDKRKARLHQSSIDE
ncbi:transglutaminase domain-containing protein [uncultured Flavobacterium sp.]|uniref:transglutaminase domain-containing protein n=1 Tax=uncultured Flavobacterium sp. TaxID=165435 RepID=UPI00292FF2F3|nr:transglutaminase domain-containing protein [uncultured Flavobacterium sp.]